MFRVLGRYFQRGGPSEPPTQHVAVGARLHVHSPGSLVIIGPLAESHAVHELTLTVWRDLGASITLGALDRVERANFLQATDQLLEFAAPPRLPSVLVGLVGWMPETSEEIRGAECNTMRLLGFSSELTWRSVDETYESVFSQHASCWRVADACSEWMLSSHLLVPRTYPTARPLVILEPEEIESPNASQAVPASAAPEPLERRFTFEDEKAVREFLKRHQALVPLLPEVAQQLSRYFDEQALPRLELVPDYEGDGEPELFVIVTTSLPIDEALARLRRFDDEWWLRAMDRAHGKLSVDFETI